mmetsp:Transcript_35453/g.57193  ORF Transcript_35453/g.57193 Transcript_35453/m.57193 type:complete len:89 (-) Transcript_35453:479-745(-)
MGIYVVKIVQAVLIGAKPHKALSIYIHIQRLKRFNQNIYPQVEFIPSYKIRIRHILLHNHRPRAFDIFYRIDKSNITPLTTVRRLTYP